MVMAPQAGGDGDHAGVLEMEIKDTRKGYTMSQYYKLHVMLILSCTLWFMLRYDLDGSMIR